MKSFSILGGKAMIVEMPEIYHDPFMWTPNVIGASFKYQDASNKITVLTLPEGRWQIVGLMPEVTEEQAARMVDDATFKYPYIFKRKFEDYSCEAENDHDTAIESLESAILAEGWYFENPYAENLRDAVNKSPNKDYGSMLEEANIFREAQSRVLCRERTLILKRN